MARQSHLLLDGVTSLCFEFHGTIQPQSVIDSLHFKSGGRELSNWSCGNIKKDTINR